MKVWFTADTHFECPELVKNTRQWTTPGEHDELVLGEINSLVKRTDRLVVCGDFCKGRPFKWRNKINCRDIWLVIGNHDRVGLAEQCFGSDRVRLALMVKLDGGEHVYCSHYPHVSWPRSHYGTYHAFGHVHSKLEETLDEWMAQRRSVDVGIDNAVKIFGKPRPFPDSYFTDVLGAREGFGIIKPEDKWKLRDYEQVDTTQ
jgi:calcineurin-like phosphoesterase family protein